MKQAAPKKSPANMKTKPPAKPGPVETLPPAEELNPKQELFVKEYLVDLNGKQAAIRAGYAERSAEVQASRLLSNDKVAEAVQKAMAKRADKVELTAQNVLDSILRIRAKAEEVDRFSDALKANELLGKHLKLFTEVKEVTFPEGVALEVSFGED